MNLTSRQKVAIYTLGCKANQADSDEFALDLQAVGLDVVSHKQPADVYIVNTCTVTAKAAYQSRQAVRRLMKKYPGSLVVVAGCDVENEKKIFEEMKGGLIVVPSRAKSDLAGIISKRLRLRPEEKETVGEYFSSRSRPFVKIQDGCENYCSYCIVPFVRGPLKSAGIKAITDKVEKISRKNFHEIVLTGIHIGHYGKDFGKKTDLSTLIEDLLKKTTIGRIRLSSLEPDELNKKLIKLVAQSHGRICPHFHVPLQSGCDTVLKRMNRRYTTEEYFNLISDIRSQLPNCSIGADVITGFPGETDREFEKTRSFIETLPITYLHVFSYSDRPQTAAFGMSDKVDEGTKKRRTSVLRGLSREKRTGFLKKRIGGKARVVFDNGRFQNCYKGISEDYINVMTETKTGKKPVYEVTLNSIDGESMTGDVI